MTAFKDLPTEVQELIFKEVDLVSVCWFYATMEEDKTYAATRYHTARYFNGRVIPVSPEKVVGGDHRYIDFDTCAKLPRCQISVNIPVGLLKKTIAGVNAVNGELVSLTVFNEYILRSLTITAMGMVPETTLVGLGRNVNLMSLTVEGGLKVNPKQIPNTVTTLVMKDSGFVPSHDISHLLNLTHFEAHALLNLEVHLPQLVTHVHAINCEYVEMHLPSLKNLRHVVWLGDNWCRIPYHQLETINVEFLRPGLALERLQELTTYEYQELTSCNLPHLRKFEVTHPPRGFSFYNVSDHLTHAQQAQLHSLKGLDYMFTNPSPLQNLKVLHMTVVEPMHKFFSLPPAVEELKIWLNFSVDGVPPQLKKFYYDYTLDSLLLGDVTIRSPNLTELHICDASHAAVECPRLRYMLIQVSRVATINCPELRTLEIRHAAEVSIVCEKLTSMELCGWERFVRLQAPNLVKLSGYGMDYPLEQFPQLRRVAIADWRCPGKIHDFIINRHMSFIHIKWSTLRKLDISADVVTLESSSLIELPRINAKVLNLKCPIKNSSHVVCQELNCTGIGRVKRFPPMVEKIYIERLNDQWVDDTTLTAEGKPSPVTFDGCDRLQSIAIRNADFRSVFCMGVSVPALVKQFTVSFAKWSDTAALHFENPSRLEHFEYWCNATMKQLGLEDVDVPSLFGPHLVPDFDEKEYMDM